MKNIYNFEDFFEFVEESLNTILDILWTKQDNTEWIGNFFYNTIEYLIKITNNNNNIWSFKFYRLTVENKYTTDMFSKKDQDFRRSLTVISTINSAATYFLDSINPNSFIFSAADSSEARKSIYEIFCMKYRDINKDYSYLIKGVNNINTYILVKKDFDRKLVFSKLIDIYNRDYNDNNIQY